MHGGAEGLHQHVAVRLRVVRGADLEDLTLQAEGFGGEGQRRAPLAGAGLGDHFGHPGLRIGVRLGDGRIGLVTADWGGTLVFVVDPGGGR